MDEILYVMLNHNINTYCDMRNSNENQLRICLDNITGQECVLADIDPFPHIDVKIQLKLAS